MIIKKIAVGNSTEAFVEDGFTDGLNIISSDDNNKGKTSSFGSTFNACTNINFSHTDYLIISSALSYYFY